VGQIIGGQAYSLHQREDLFPDATKFDPERWLMKNEKTGAWEVKNSPGMNAALQPFCEEHFFFLPCFFDG
jgi:cytochrome P450